MKIAFIGHSYHSKTGSSAFFIELLSELGTVDVAWDDSWLRDEAPRLGPSVLDADLVVLWQVEQLAPQLAASGHRNVVFVPMFDSCQWLAPAWWRSLRGLRVLSFCAEVHRRVQQAGLVSLYVQYYPDPTRYAPVCWRDGLRGFLWQRRAAPSWATVEALAGDADFRGFHLHAAPDPGFARAHLPDPRASAWKLSVSHWLAQRADYDRLLDHANVFFAPRTEEGIGMSFLEAMARGMLVIAPNRPTHNEYFVDGINGLLYDPLQPRRLDLSRAQALGARARASVVAGHARWLRAREPVLQFLLGIRGLAQDRAHTRSGDASGRPEHDSARDGTGAEEVSEQARLGLPKGASVRVSVITVVRNAPHALRQTLDNVLAQTYPALELVVVDGASEAPTREVIEAYSARLDVVVSEADAGPYDAMNKGARLASGDWLLFMNAGDEFIDTHALAEALAAVPEHAGVVYGHHFYRTVDGVEQLHYAADFDQTWARLCAGRLAGDWLHGMPCHQATLVRRNLLLAHPYDLSLRIAADHDQLFRLKRQLVQFHHSNTTIARYVGGGLSWQRRELCVDEWTRVALRYTEQPNAVRRFYRSVRRDVQLSIVRERGIWRGTLRLLGSPALMGYLVGKALPLRVLRALQRRYLRLRGKLQQI